MEIYYAISKDAEIYYELGEIDNKFIELKSRSSGEFSYEYDIISISRHTAESEFGIMLASFFRLFKDAIIVSEDHAIIDDYHCIGSVYWDKGG
jgi:hypothetical protein